MIDYNSMVSSLKCVVARFFISFSVSYHLTSTSRNVDITVLSAPRSRSGSRGDDRQPHLRPFSYFATFFILKALENCTSLHIVKQQIKGLFLLVE